MVAPRNLREYHNDCASGVVSRACHAFDGKQLQLASSVGCYRRIVQFDHAPVRVGSEVTGVTLLSTHSGCLVTASDFKFSRNGVTERWYSGKEVSG